METKEILLYAGFFICGLVIGSFLEVVIYRVPRKISIVIPGSFCPNCNARIAFYNNIPLISFLALKGRCRNCRARISYKTFIIEILTGGLFALNYFFFGLSIQTVTGIIFVSVLIAVSFIDIDLRIIPNIIVLPFTIVGIALNIYIDPARWWVPLVFCAGAFTFMLIINLIYPKGMGMGDVKLSMMVGAFLVKSVIVGLFLGFLAGAVFGIAVIIKKRKMHQTIPFGPFISLGSIIALFWGDNILKWYTGFF
ncbi:MAG: prepilin peptidase [Actinobacteria bacterium]|nr:prepilin peptidase [Actinomycetota bacterium]